MCNGKRTRYIALGFSGVRCNRFLHVCASADDVVTQNKMQRALGQRTGTCFQRCVGEPAPPSCAPLSRCSLPSLARPALPRARSLRISQLRCARRYGGGSGMDAINSCYSITFGTREPEPVGMWAVGLTSARSLRHRRCPRHTVSHAIPRLRLDHAGDLYSCRQTAPPVRYVRTVHM